MRIIDWLIQGDTKNRYVKSILKQRQNGFTNDESSAMAWICKQKAQGKFWGASTGLFLAFTWGHYHDQVIQYFRVNFNRKFTQLGIIMVYLF